MQGKQALSLRNSASCTYYFNVFFFFFHCSEQSNTMISVKLESRMKPGVRSHSGVQNLGTGVEGLAGKKRKRKCGVAEWYNEVRHISSLSFRPEIGYPCGLRHARLAEAVPPHGNICSLLHAWLFSCPRFRARGLGACCRL